MDVCLSKAAGFGLQGGEKRGGIQKFSNFELGIEIYVKKSKESSGAILFSKFSIFHKLQLFKKKIPENFSFWGSLTGPPADIRKLACSHLKVLSAHK